jgi:hypothetical protein
MARSRLIRSEPSLAAEERRYDIETERIIAAEVGQRTGADPSVDLGPRLAAAVVVAAIHTAVQYWLDVPDAGTLRDALDSVMRRFRLEEVPS